MKKDGYSRPGFFGTINHYDASGKKVGESRPGFFGGMNNYDANGHKVGHSSPGFPREVSFISKSALIFSSYSTSTS